MLDMPFSKILCGAAGLLLLCSLTLNRCQHERITALSAELGQALGTNLEQTLALSRLDAEIRLNNALLSQQELTKREIRQDREKTSRHLEQESQTNEPYKNWADQPLPDAVLRVFSGADSDQNGDNKARSANGAASANSGTCLDRNPEQRPSSTCAQFALGPARGQR
jgi:hypothetical protein